MESGNLDLISVFQLSEFWTAQQWPFAKIWQNGHGRQLVLLKGRKLRTER